MPTRRKPQLTHQSVAHAELSKRIHQELCAKEVAVLERLGFYRKFGKPGDPSYTGKDEATEVLREITGVLVTAATIWVDAGYKAPSQLIATLNAVREMPTLILCDTLEPEARGALGAAYQRKDEPPGTFWFDIDGYGVGPDDKRVRAAAERAIVKLQQEAAPGRRTALDVQYLTTRLREIFLRFNPTITRKSVVSSHGHGKLFQQEDGPFFLFVEGVLVPLNRYFGSLPSSTGLSTRDISAAYITRLAAKGKSRR
jgi:hypothetical protein